MWNFVRWLLSLFFSKAHPPPPRHNRFEDQVTTETSESGFSSDDSSLEEEKDIVKATSRDALWRIGHTQSFLWRTAAISRHLELLETSTGRQVTPLLQLVLYFTAATTQKRPTRNIILRHSMTSRAIGKTNMKARQTGMRSRNRTTRTFNICGVSCDKRLPPPPGYILTDSHHPWNTPEESLTTQAHFKANSGRLLRHWTMVVEHHCPDLANRVEVTMLVNHGQHHKHVNMFPPDLLMQVPKFLPLMKSYLPPMEEPTPPTPPRSWLTSTPLSPTNQPKVTFHGTLSGHRETQSLDGQSYPKETLDQTAQTRKRVREGQDDEIDLIPPCSIRNLKL